MKILIASTYDGSNGSGRAAYRLHSGLKKANVESEILVQMKITGDEDVKSPQTKVQVGINNIRQTLDALPLKLYRQRDKSFMSLQWVPDQFIKQVTALDPDIVNLHWTNDAFIQIESLPRINKPLVWSLHDMWAFTGGCHYDQDCGRYLRTCGSCPQLGSHTDWDLSRWVWQRKAKAWKKLDLTVVALCNWMANCARESSLLQNVPIEVIPNGIDTSVYRPIDKHAARQILGLPEHKQLILFGALKATSDSRKGLHLLKPALEEITQLPWQDELELVIFGSSQPEQPLDFGFPTHYLGAFNDDVTLAMAYSAADVFVAPSTQENLANTVMESIACGTPCVAFNIGGMPDMIEHEKNGYLAKPFYTDDLAKGIIWVLGNQERHQRLCEYSRFKAEHEFNQKIQAERYISLFSKIKECHLSKAF